ncbi:MAG: hypothetical protein LUC33_02970 [Prevotellaceae bacterium]|nr:hypothetical protein [Prevotellaceae bacterium]
MPQDNGTHISSALHLNKDGLNERGHLGSLLLQKGECNILVSREPDSPHIEVKPYKMGGRTLNFKPFWVSMAASSDGCPAPMTAPKQEMPKSIKERIEDLLRRFYSENGKVGKTNAELTSWIETASKTASDPVGLKRGTVSKALSRLAQEGLLVRDTDNGLLYPFGTLLDATQQSLNLDTDDERATF